MSKPIRVALYVCLAYAYLRIGQELINGISDSQSIVHLVGLTLGIHGVLLWKRAEQAERGPAAELPEQTLTTVAVAVSIGACADFAVVVLSILG